MIVGELVKIRFRGSLIDWNGVQHEYEWLSWESPTGNHERVNDACYHRWRPRSRTHSNLVDDEIPVPSARAATSNPIITSLRHARFVTSPKLYVCIISTPLPFSSTCLSPYLAAGSLSRTWRFTPHLLYQHLMSFKRATCHLNKPVLITPHDIRDNFLSL